MSSRDRDRIRVNLGRTSLDLPAQTDPKLLEAAAVRVTETLARIERESARIDSLAFALQAAVEFAAQLIELEEEQTRQSHELIRTLATLADRLEQLLERHEG